MLILNTRLPHHSFEKKSNNQGFTLIEMVMSIVVLGILAGIIAPIFSQGLSLSQFATESLQSQEKLRFTMERIARELRAINHTGANYDVSSMSTTSITFIKNDAASTQVTISLSGSNAQISYSTPAMSEAINDEVSSLGFTYYDVSGNTAVDNISLAFVQVTLQLTNAVSGAVFDQHLRIALRDRS